MDWTETLPGFRGRAWDALEDGVARADAPARRVGLASVGLDGGPELRTVVLRAANRGAASLEIHTDRETGKIAELQAEPRASLLAWIPESGLQIRLRVTVAIRTGPALDTLWQAVPQGARINYGGRPLPGRPLPHPGIHDPTVERPRFTVLACAIREMDLLFQGTTRRRAVFRDTDGFAGEWVAP